MLLHVHPVAELVFDYEYGDWFAGEVGGQLGAQSWARDVLRECAVGDEGAWGASVVVGERRVCVSLCWGFGRD